MFIETRELPVTVPTGLPSQPARVGRYHELAEAMRLGMKVVRPLSSYGPMSGVFADTTEGCALCCLAVGLGEPVGRALYHSPNYSRIGETWIKLSDKYGEDLMQEIEDRFEGLKEFEPHSFIQIANWLCREGGCEHAL